MFMPHATGGMIRIDDYTHTIETVYMVSSLGVSLYMRSLKEKLFTFFHKYHIPNADETPRQSKSILSNS